MWLPGYSRLAGLTTDDTFNGPSSQLYLYTTNNQDGVFADRGALWAFRVTGTDDGRVDPKDAFNGANDYLDIRPGDDFRGEFIRVPKRIARGETGLAPQAALEEWSNANNVFQFIRLEDLGYDPDQPNVVYDADTGRSRVVPSADTGRLERGPGGTIGMADNGAVFRVEMNTRNPRKVDNFTMIAQGDDPTQDAFVGFVSPDNLGVSSASLMIQEDTDDASIWRHDLASGDWDVVATVNDPDGEFRPSAQTRLGRRLFPLQAVADDDGSAEASEVNSVGCVASLSSTSSHVGSEAESTSSGTLASSSTERSSWTSGPAVP